MQSTFFYIILIIIYLLLEAKLELIGDKKRRIKLHL